MSLRGIVRCEQCGTENEDMNRYCGMCGVPLAGKQQAGKIAAPPSPARGSQFPLRTNEPISAKPFAVSNSLTAAPSESGRLDSAQVAGTVVREYPIISGPSFLGLNQLTAKNRNARNENDPNSPDRDATDLDYLLENEEEPRRGWGKLAAVIVALALLGGFGYLRWKQGGFDWLMKERITQTSEAKGAQSGTSLGAPAVSPETSDSAKSSPRSAATAAGGNGGTTPAGEGAQRAETSGTNPRPADSSPAAGAQANEAPTQADSAPADQAANREPGSIPASANAAQAEENSGNSGQSPSPAKLKPARAKPVPRPRPSPVIAAEPSIEAQRYIYGRGAAQDCDRGLQLLKPAAAHSNVKAMTMLGSLYSSGTCAPRDLPTSYRWFALALRVEPANPALQIDLQNIWGKMTLPERQLAIKLSH